MSKDVLFVSGRKPSFSRFAPEKVKKVFRVVVAGRYCTLSVDSFSMIDPFKFKYLF